MQTPFVFMLFKHKSYEKRKTRPREENSRSELPILVIPGVSQDNIFYNIISEEWVFYPLNLDIESFEKPKKISQNSLRMTLKSEENGGYSKSSIEDNKNLRELIIYNAYIPFCFKEGELRINLEAYMNPSTGHWLDSQKINPPPQLEQRLDLLFLGALYSANLSLPNCKTSRNSAKYLFSKIRKIKIKHIRI